MRAMSVRSFRRLLARRSGEVAAHTLPRSRSSSEATGRILPRTVPDLGALDKVEVARVCLDLDPEVRPRVVDVDRVGEGPHLKRLPQEVGCSLHVFGGDGDVQIEAHHRLRVGVDAYTSDDAEAQVIGLEDGEHTVEELGLVADHEAPKLPGLHATR